MALDAMFLFTGSDDGSILIWNLTSVEEAYQLSSICAHTSSVRSLCFVEAVCYLVSCASDGYIRVWNYNEEGTNSSHCGKLVEETHHPQEFRCIAYHPQRHQIVAGTEAASVMLFPLGGAKRHDPDQSQHE